MASSSRSTSTVLGILAGAVALGVLVFFAVALPRLSSEPEGSGSGSGSGGGAIALPDTLPGGFTAADLVTDAGQDAAESADIKKSQEQARVYAEALLADVYDAPSDTRDYVSDDLSSFATVTVIDAPGGAFLPDGIQAPEVLGLARPAQELVRQGDAVCLVNWQQAVPEGTAIDPSELPAYTSCQRSSGDLTVQLAANQRTAADTVALLDDLFGTLAS